MTAELPPDMWPEDDEPLRCAWITNCDNPATTFRWLLYWRGPDGRVQTGPAHPIECCAAHAAPWPLPPR